MKTAASARWLKVGRNDGAKPETFLRAREESCVAACAGFLKARDGGNGRVWRFDGERGEVAALLIRNRRTLFPVFGGRADVPPPKFLSGLFSRFPVHAVQGLSGDVAVLTDAMKRHGYRPGEHIDYDLLGINAHPDPSCFRYAPPAIQLRPAIKEDLDELYYLQAAYEQEEVLPKGSEFYPAACRANLERLFSTQQMLLACMYGEIVGKINTSAASFTRYQVGGVYVKPEYRGRGIAVRMAAVFIRGLIDEGKGVTLYVKKSNAPARAVYERVGFKSAGDYRICYFKNS